jgi:LAO/AO transport system kinase
MPTTDQVAAGLLARDRRSLARVLSWIEAGDTRGQSAVQYLGASTAAGYTVGVTGAPGAGKSTLTNALIATIRRAQQSVAVLAIDPSSPLTGGALLGDRIRMTDHIHDPDVYIRSMATRGDLGGLATAVPAALRVLQIFGFDWLIVETVGVGQVQVDIAAQADTTIVVVNPGWGDDVQASKAGILEIADVFAVNKADRPGADDTVLELSNALALAPARPWKTPIIGCVGHTGHGVEQLWQALADHRAHLSTTGRLDEHRRQRRIRDLTVAVHELALKHARNRLTSSEFATLIATAADGDIDPLTAAHQIFGDNEDEVVVPSGRVLDHLEVAADRERLPIAEGSH